MKRILIVAACLALTHLTVTAQSFKWGIRVGVSTPDIKPADVSPIKVNGDSILLKVNDAGYGFHFGGWVRLNISKLFIQPELVFNSSRVTYKVSALKPNVGLLDSLSKESFLNLDIPLLLGTKLGAFRINAGPVGHLHLTNTSDLGQIKSYKSKFESMKWGYQAGVGADFGKLGIDIRYEGNFSKFGDHLNIGNTDYEFDKSPSRLIVSMAIGF